MALIIDPTAELLPRKEPRSAVESSAPPGPAIQTPEPLGDSSPGPARVLASSPKAPSAPVAPLADVYPRMSGLAGARAAAVFGALPGVAPGAEWVAEAPVALRSQLALRLSALYLPERRQHTGLGDISYGLTALEAGACGGRWTAWLGWSACAALGVGAIHTVVHAPIPLRAGDRLWAALRLEAGLGCTLLVRFGSKHGSLG